MDIYFDYYKRLYVGFNATFPPILGFIILTNYMIYYSLFLSFLVILSQHN